MTSFAGFVLALAVLLVIAAIPEGRPAYRTVSLLMAIWLGLPAIGVLVASWFSYKTKGKIMPIESVLVYTSGPATPPPHPGPESTEEMVSWLVERVPLLTRVSPAGQAEIRTGFAKAMALQSEEDLQDLFRAARDWSFWEGVE